jgi:hypothetical protein
MNSGRAVERVKWMRVRRKDKFPLGCKIHAMAVSGIVFFSPAVAYGHGNGGVPHLHPHGLEILAAWGVILVAFLPFEVVKRICVARKDRRRFSDDEHRIFADE